MEYNLQKTLNNEADYESNHLIDFNIERFEDETPGIGQIVPYDNFIVPLHHNSDLTTIFKESITEQLGGGQEIDEKEETTPLDNNDKTFEIQEENVEKSGSNNLKKNESTTKRKNMDPAIFDSFMHPKMFKTKLVSLDSNSQSKNTVKKNESSVEKKLPKHKFKIF